MKSLVRLIVALVVALAFAAAGSAQMKPESPAQPEKKAGAPKASRVTGEVVKVDAKAGIFTVKGKEKELSLTAESKGTKSSLEKVKVGDRVRVLYTEKDGKLIASSVTASKRAAQPKPMEKPAEKKIETK